MNTMVLGALERGGEVRFKVDKRPNRKTLHAFINSVVDDDAEAIHTDDWYAYRGIEGVWSLFKRLVVGSRENPCLFRDTLLRLVRPENLPYSELVAQA